LPVPSHWKEVTLQNVWFRYSERGVWSAQGIDLTLEQGKFYGFVGRSGAGKTTLVNILLGLLEPSRGSVLINGRKLDDFSISSWQKLFGYVPQDAFILDGTILENITFGDGDLDKARLDESIKQAQLTEVVRALSKGVDTQVGERGRQLSGGQAQRLAIARALYRRPEILFLDEATSALDGITETELYEGIVDLRGHVTAFIIAHRVTTLRHCDRIFVLDQGQIAASGTYDELLKQSEIFRGLAAQAEKPSEEPLPATV
jgi:ATP-binding cassette, subfamily B, bacterial PglK